MATITLNSCEVDYAGFSQSISTKKDTSVIPTNMWISGALDQIESLNNSPVSYVVYKDFSLPVGTSKLYFYNENNLGKASFQSDSSHLHELYFENGHLVFSVHQDKKNNRNLVAYANGQPYAAASEIDSNWQAINPKHLHLNQPFFTKAIALSTKAAAHEKNPSFDYRICQLNDTIKGELPPSQNAHFVMNVIKNDAVRIFLQADSDDVFFTVGEVDGVNMERTKWNASARKTGDLRITVFSTTPQHKNYTLIAERLTNESQLSLQGLGQNW